MRSVQNRLLAIFVLALSTISGPAAGEGRVALVIGNAAYQKAGVLRTPANDAADISVVLERIGFTVSTLTNADGSAFTDALARFGDEAQGADVALFWYAGHGLQFNEANHLLPVDAKLDNEFALRREAFALNDIIKRIETSAKVSLIFIDASHETPLIEKLKASLKTPERAASIGRGLARVESQNRDTLIMFATPPGEVAGEGNGRNSPFAEAMLKHIETPGVDVEVMLKDVTSDVRRATRERQRPERLSRLESKVVLNQGGGDDVRGIVPVPAGPVPQAAEKRREEAIEAEERRQKADQEAEAAALRKREADEQARAAEERKRQFDDEAKRKTDEAVERRRAEALRQAEEAEQRKIKAEQDAAAADEKRRKAEEDAKAAEEKAQKAEEGARETLGDDNQEWQDYARRRREALQERRESWGRFRDERRREADEWYGRRRDRRDRRDDDWNPGRSDWWGGGRDRGDWRGRRRWQERGEGWRGQRY